MEKHNSIKLLSLSAMFAALIFVVTAYLHIPTTRGYVHIGDGLIFLAASMLPAPYAMGAAAIGAALSDGLSGYMIWVPGTLIIKAATALLFTAKAEKILCTRNFAALVGSLVLCAGGYWFYQAAVVLGGLTKASMIASAADIPANIAQTLCSAAVYLFAAKALDAMGIKKKLGVVSVKA